MTGLLRARAVGGRVLRQIARDRRFLGLALLAPLFVVYLLKVFLASVDVPFFRAETIAVPAGAFIVHFITYVLTAIVLVRERSEQTLARMFANGFRQREIIGGYMAAYTALATLQSALVLSELAWLFELDYPASRFASLYLVMWMLSIISMSLGIFVSNFARNEGQVLPFIPLVVVPSLFLSGVIIPVEDLPAWTRALSRLTPLYHADAVLDPLLKTGGRLVDAGWALLGLPVYGVVVLTLAAFTLRERD